MELSCSPVLIDLCCGTGGWADGFLAAGWEVFGFDVVDRGYSGHLALADVRLLSGARWAGKVDLIVASPPCQEFSLARTTAGVQRRGFDTSIWRACVERSLEAGCPIIIENVRGACRVFGPAFGRSGSRFFWGNGCPALLPYGRKEWQKGGKSNWDGRAAERRAHIPFELALWFAKSCWPARCVEPASMNGGES
jgi:hypothetical protein